MAEISWLLFLAASLVVILTPGQDMILVMSRSIGQGPRAGIVTAAGVSVGLVGHILLATLGLGALLHASELLFQVLKLIGATYLVYLGLRLLKTAADRHRLRTVSHRSLPRLFVEGALSNLSNPKITLFYFAFLPQFVSAAAPQPALSLLALGIVFAALTFVVKGPIGYGAGALSGWLRSHAAVLAWLNRTSGAVLIGLGVRLAFEEPR